MERLCRCEAQMLAKAKEAQRPQGEAQSNNQAAGAGEPDLGGAQGLGRRGPACGMLAEQGRRIRGAAGTRSRGSLGAWGREQRWRSRGLRRRPDDGDGGHMGGSRGEARVRVSMCSDIMLE